MEKTLAVHPQIADLLQAVVKNSPGKLLPAHKRYALSVIADQQAERITSDEFAKSAAQGISPDALAADKAADQMAAAVGIQPPPLPAPLPMGAAGAGQEAFQQAQGYGSPGGQIAGPGATAMAAQAQPGAQPGPSNPPPNTYFDLDRNVSVYDPNYHGPYVPISKGFQGGQASVTGAPAQGQAAQPGAEMPTLEVAQLDQGKIDHAWKMFDLAMSRMPQAPEPAKVREVGMAQLFAMVAAGVIDPAAGAAVGKAIFEAPVMAKQIEDQQNRQDYGDSVRMWQNETTRYQQAALGVERSELSKQKNAQDVNNARYNKEFGLYSQGLKQEEINDRNERDNLSSQLNKLTTSRYSGKAFSPDEVRQLDEAINATREALGIRGPLVNSKGEPTAAYNEVKSRIDKNKQWVEQSEAQVRLITARTGLTEEQMIRVRTLLPKEMDKMDAQTAQMWGNRMRAVYSAMLDAERIKDMGFQRSLARDKMRLEAAKTSLSVLQKELGEKTKDRDKLLKAADKAEGQAAELEKYRNLETGKFSNDAQQSAYDAYIKEAQDARAEAMELDKPGGAIDELGRNVDDLTEGLRNFEPTAAPTGGTPGYSEMSGQAGAPKSSGFDRERFVAAARANIGKPYVRGGGRRKGEDTNMDCSGLVCEALESMGLKPPGATADEMFKNTQSVQPEQAQIGDLLFFQTDSDSAVDHVGIYTGNGKMVHASSAAGKTVEVDIGKRRLVKIGAIVGNGGKPIEAKVRETRGKQSENNAMRIMKG